MGRRKRSLPVQQEKNEDLEAKHARIEESDGKVLFHISRKPKCMVLQATLYGRCVGGGVLSGTRKRTRFIIDSHDNFKLAMRYCSNSHITNVIFCCLYLLGLIMCITYDC